MQTLKLIRLWYALGFALLLAVALGSLLPMASMPDIGVGDKPSHLFAYVVLSGWFCLLARNHTMVACSVAALFGYGILIEFLQGLTGYRYAEWGDVIANGSGCLLGSIFYFTPLRRLFHRIDKKLAA
jgi:VanZ family protein